MSHIFKSMMWNQKCTAVLAMCIKALLNTGKKLMQVYVNVNINVLLNEILLVKTFVFFSPTGNVQISFYIRFS